MNTFCFKRDSVDDDDDDDVVIVVDVDVEFTLADVFDKMAKNGKVSILRTMLIYDE